MMRFVEKKMEEPSAALLELGLHPRMAQLLAARGIESPEAAKAFLSPTLADLHDPFLMQDMRAAVECVEEALAEHKRITIYGDYDVDGVTATALLLTYLRKRGGQVSFYIPARHGEGYGLNLGAVEKLSATTDLLITVDCGITSAKEVARAKELGMCVIVTDHHQIGEAPVLCEAVLNPLLGSYPFPKLCGAGVALKLVQAMGGPDAIAPLLDLAALATVADLVPMVGENRVLVTAGLQVLRTAQRPGLRALMEVSGLKAEELSAGQVGFQIAPRINAGGRLADASQGVELLTTRDMQAAQRIAQALDAENKERQLVEQHILEEAEAMIPEHIDFLRDRAIVLCGEAWNPGVIGLAASRLVERYRWPTILLAREGDLCVGSARSIPGINIHAALWGCRDLFLRFGGHAQAAGLTMSVSAIPALRKHLNAAIAAQAQPDTFIPTEHYDFELSLAEVQESLVTQLEQLQPTGIGNPSPQFCVRGAAPMEARTVGREGAHLKLYLAQDGEVREGIAFRMGPIADSLPERVDALFSASLNVWQGRRTVQCEVRHLLPHTVARDFLAVCARSENGFFRAICEQLLYNSSVNHSTALDFTAPEPIELGTDALDSAIRATVEADAQGTLLVVHTLSALRKWTVRLALMQAEFQYSFGLPTDCRAFNTVCAAPSFAAFALAKAAPVQYARVMLLDGALSEGELSAWRSLYPDAEIAHAKDAALQLRMSLAPHVPDDDAMRAVYKALRSAPTSLSSLAAQIQGTEPLACIALHVLQELELVECEFSPWQVSLTAPRKSNLEDSTLLCALRALVASA